MKKVIVLIFSFLLTSFVFGNYTIKNVATVDWDNKYLISFEIGGPLKKFIFSGDNNNYYFFYSYKGIVKLLKVNIPSLKYSIISLGKSEGLFNIKIDKNYIRLFYEKSYFSPSYNECVYTFNGKEVFCKRNIKFKRKTEAEVKKEVTNKINALLKNTGYDLRDFFIKHKDHYIIRKNGQPYVECSDVELYDISFSNFLVSCTKDKKEYIVTKYGVYGPYKGYYDGGYLLTGNTFYFYVSYPDRKRGVEVNSYLVGVNNTLYTGNSFKYDNYLLALKSGKNLKLFSFKDKNSLIYNKSGFNDVDVNLYGYGYYSLIYGANTPPFTKTLKLFKYEPFVKKTIFIPITLGNYIILPSFGDNYLPIVKLKNDKIYFSLVLNSSNFNPNYKRYFNKLLINNYKNLILKKYGKKILLIRNSKISVKRLNTKIILLMEKLSTNNLSYSKKVKLISLLEALRELINYGK